MEGEGFQETAGGIKSAAVKLEENVVEDQIGSQAQEGEGASS